VKKALRWAGWLAIAAAGAFLALQLSYLARVWWWRDHDPGMTAFMEARLEQMRREDPHARLRHAWVPYGRISASLKRAVVVAEDSRFVDHDGFDWEAIEKAREKNVKRGRIVAGGSTISQQLAKNLFLSASRTPWRKGEEALITLLFSLFRRTRRFIGFFPLVL
jgi:monofunctional biosynthetic peptidoglycan transglycosylase